MTLATMGRAQHMALSSAAEAYTITFLTEQLKERPEICSVTIIGTPVLDVGELGYFSEDNGLWLQATFERLSQDIQMRVNHSNNVKKSDLACELHAHWMGEWPQARLEVHGFDGKRH